MGTILKLLNDKDKTLDKKEDERELVTDEIKCLNPSCITSTEQELPHVFKVVDKENKIYRCIYCEKDGIV